MELTEAVGILQFVADGVDPFTGEVFPEDSPYQRVGIVRALYVAINALGNAPVESVKIKKERKLPENAGKSWTQEEDALLGERFDSGMTTKELMAEHGRTQWAIQSRLVKLGKITAG